MLVLLHVTMELSNVSKK